MGNDATSILIASTLTFLLAGCAAGKQSRPSPGDSEKPEPRVLSHALEPGERHALRAAAERDIDEAERILDAHSAVGELGGAARSLLEQARAALAADDPVRARNLAEKARQIADELSP